MPISRGMGEADVVHKYIQWDITQPWKGMKLLSAETWMDPETGHTE